MLGVRRRHAARRVIPLVALAALAMHVALQAWRSSSGPGPTRPGRTTVDSLQLRGSHGAKRTRRAAIGAQLPPTLRDRVDLSIIMQRSVPPKTASASQIERMAAASARQVRAYRRCAVNAGLTTELLLHVRVDTTPLGIGKGGKMGYSSYYNHIAKVWIDVAAEHGVRADYLILEPKGPDQNHENSRLQASRNFGRLALMSRGRMVLQAPNTGFLSCTAVHKALRQRNVAVGPPTKPELDVSFVIQYWGASGNGHAKLVPHMLQRLRSCAHSAALRTEVLVNDDSRHSANGDASQWLRWLSPGDWLTLAPNIHELRAYNRLGWAARGDVLLFMQDDQLPPPIQLQGAQRCDWLSILVTLLRSPRAALGVIGLHQVMFFVAEGDAGFDEGDMGSQVLERGDGTVLQPRCRMRLALRSGRQVQVAVEAARCVDMGPLAVLRRVFIEVGGYNESYSALGVPGSVAVDCELEARMWLAGKGVITAMPPQINATSLDADAPVLWSSPKGSEVEGVKTHTAWAHPQMKATHTQRMMHYYHLYEAPDAPFATVIGKAVLAYNRRYQCPSKGQLLSRFPDNHLDCGVTAEREECIETWGL